MKVYKFFKDDCVPCRTLSKVLALMDLPEDVEIVPVDVRQDVTFTKKSGVVSVPTLMLENGSKMIGVKSVKDIQTFIGIGG